MAILLISRVFPPRVGGSGRWFFEIYRRLEHTSCLICTSEHSASTAFDPQTGLRIMRLPLDLPDWGCFSLGGFRQYSHLSASIRRLTASSDLEVIHSGSLLPDGWLGHKLAAKLDLPHWVYMHGEEKILAQSSRQLHWMGRRILRAARGIIANSDNTRRVLTEFWGVDLNKVQVLHPGVDCARFTPAPPSSELRTALGWHDRPTILTVGRLQPRKGQDMLIRALVSIRHSIPNVLFAIVGDGEDRARLEKLVREHGLEDHVIFHGEIDDEMVARAYQQCDLFVLPNREIDGDIEGFGMVLLEAQACGRPVVAGRSGGTSETMIEGETGLLLDCTSPEDLGHQLPGLLRDRPRLDVMGQAGRNWVERNFDWPALARKAKAILV